MCSSRCIPDGVRSARWNRRLSRWYARGSWAATAAPRTVWISVAASSSAGLARCDGEADRRPLEHLADDVELPHLVASDPGDPVATPWFVVDQTLTDQGLQRLPHRDRAHDEEPGDGLQRDGGPGWRPAGEDHPTNLVEDLLLAAGLARVDRHQPRDQRRGLRSLRHLALLCRIPITRCREPICDLAPCEEGIVAGVRASMPSGHKVVEQGAKRAISRDHSPREPNGTRTARWSSSERSEWTVETTPVSRTSTGTTRRLSLSKPTPARRTDTRTPGGRAASEASGQSRPGPRAKPHAGATRRLSLSKPTSVRRTATAPPGGRAASEASG